MESPDDRRPHRRRWLADARRCGRFARSGISAALLTLFSTSAAWAELSEPPRSMVVNEPAVRPPGVVALGVEPLPPLTQAEEPYDFEPSLPEEATFGSREWLARDFGWDWQYLPDELLYHSYLAGGRESRFASIWAFQEGFGWVWDVALGGRVGILRYGTPAGVPEPEGFQLDVEGAAFPRLDLEDNRDMIAADFRFGIPWTFASGPWRTKLAYYHLSSHLADEFILKTPNADRINYSRDVIVLGLAHFLTEDVRVYGEMGWAFYTSGGSKPWEFQFGAEYSPLAPVWNWATGSPFFAVNGRIREEVDFGGNVIVQAGWQFRGGSGHRFRLGAQYFNGKSDQYQFFREHEEQIAAALWYDY
jgi:Protein of unknown function (DUF1207)